MHEGSDLKRLYEARFAGRSEYRRAVWERLCRYFEQWIQKDATVLDLGCGCCEFINAVHCGKKIGMDLNPDAEKFAQPDIKIIQQNCADPWEIAQGSLDVIFTSNFLEHLPHKNDVETTLQQAHRALARGGRFIAVGPNIKYIPGLYWDFFDHLVPLTDISLGEALRSCGFEIELSRDKFLPYTMSRGRQYPVWMLDVYLSLPIVWGYFGQQFFVVGRKMD